MDEALKAESEKLERSWMQHEAKWLDKYLVSGVEDPRINLQSVFTRHFLLRELFGDRFQALMEQEYLFSAAMNWLVEVAQHTADDEEPGLILEALRRGADNAEGRELPRFLVHLFASLPLNIGELTIPNFIESFLTGTQFNPDGRILHQPSLNTFQVLWRSWLECSMVGSQGKPEKKGNEDEDENDQKVPEDQNEQKGRGGRSARLSVFEPACGSANDYRFLDAYGIAPLLNYTGLELCEKNVENARTLFPGVRFEPGNVFELSAAAKTFDVCFVHDLFEHLSLAGFSVAVGELCRVTRRAICIGFFSMAEMPEHIVRPVEDYHWNTLSLSRTKELFAAHGFTTHAVHIETFLRQQVGFAQTHNPNAYTLFLRRA